MSALGFVALGCSTLREVHLTQPVAMSAMPEATLKVELSRVLVSDGIANVGFGEDSSLVVVLGVTNVGRESYTLYPASTSCWLELSPDRPGDTRALAPVGGGEGADPGDSNFGSSTIPPGETRQIWIRFRGYRYADSDVPRKVVIWFSDARGRRVELVIADPARGQRWEVKPLAFGMGAGVRMTSLIASDLNARAMDFQLFWLWRMGPLLVDVGLNESLLVQRGGRLISETSGFDNSLNLNAHISVPLVRWNELPRSLALLGIYGGGGAGFLNEITQLDSNGTIRGSYEVLSAEGGIELGFSGSQPVASPFPISFSEPSLPRWMVRAGYTHWWVNGNDVSADSEGLATTLRFTW